MNKKRNLTLRYGLVQLIYWFSFAPLAGFASVYLLDAGLNNSQIGITLALGCLAAAVVQPAVGSLIDRNPNITNKNTLTIFGFALITIAALMYLLPFRSPLMLMILYILGMMFLHLSSPFVNALGVASINVGYTVNFGISRAGGSVGYALGSWLVGQISLAAGAKSIPVCMIAAFLLEITVIVLYPLNERKEQLPGQNSSSESKAASSSIDFLKKYKIFAVLLIGLVLIYIGHSMINGFAVQILTPIGGTSADMGSITAFCSVLEVIPMFLFAKLMKRFKLSTLVMASGIFFSAKVLATLLAGSIPAYYMVQLLQVGGWGIMAVGLVYYVNDLVDPADSAQGQAFAGMTMTLGTVLGNLIAGNALEYGSVPIMILIGFVISSVGTVIIAISTAKGEKAKKA